MSVTARIAAVLIAAMTVVGIGGAAFFVAALDGNPLAFLAIVVLLLVVCAAAVVLLVVHGGAKAAAASEAAEDQTPLVPFDRDLYGDRDRWQS